MKYGMLQTAGETLQWVSKTQIASGFEPDAVHRFALTAGRSKRSGYRLLKKSPLKGLLRIVSQQLSFFVFIYERSQGMGEPFHSDMCFGFDAIAPGSSAVR